MPEGAVRNLGACDLRWPAVSICTLGGVGLLRPAPGTWGSIAACVAVWPLVRWLPPTAITPVMIVLALLALLIGLLAVPSVIERCGQLDPGSVVIDEALGCWVAIGLLPGVLLAEHGLPALVICGLFFRCFDIIKPVPISWLEALPGSAGVMLDDLLAGLMAGACAFAFLH